MVFLLAGKVSDFQFLVRLNFGLISSHPVQKLDWFNDGEPNPPGNIQVEMDTL
jgi:hypothetical protein